MREIIRDFLLTLSERSDQIGDDEPLLEAGLIDSLKMLELVGYLHDTYGVEVVDRDLVPQNFETIASIARFMEAKGVAR